MKCRPSQKLRPELRDDGRFIQRDLNRPAAAFELVPRTRRVHENAPHDATGHGKEVRAALPLHSLDVNESQIRLVHEGSRLQGVTRTLVRHVSTRNPMQFPVHERHQPFEMRRLRPAPTPATTRLESGTRPGCPISSRFSAIESGSTRTARVGTDCRTPGGQKEQR